MYVMLKNPLKNTKKFKKRRDSVDYLAASFVFLFLKSFVFFSLPVLSGRCVLVFSDYCCDNRRC